MVKIWNLKRTGHKKWWRDQTWILRKWQFWKSNDDKRTYRLTLDKADIQTKISFIQTNLKTTCTANHKQKHIRKQRKKGAKSRFSNSPSATVS